MCYPKPEVIMYTKCGPQCPRQEYFLKGDWRSLDAIDICCSREEADEKNVQAWRFKYKPSCGVRFAELKPPRVKASWGCCYECKENGWAVEEDNGCAKWKIRSADEIKNEGVGSLERPEVVEEEEDPWKAWFEAQPAYLLPEEIVGSKEWAKQKRKEAMKDVTDKKAAEIAPPKIVMIDRTKEGKQSEGKGKSKEKEKQKEKAKEIKVNKVKAKETEEDEEKSGGKSKLTWLEKVGKKKRTK